MNTESPLVKINATALSGKYTMQEAINMCRQRAMSGETIDLSVRASGMRDWVHLGCYEPAKPLIYTDRYTGEKEKVQCCLVTLEPPKKYHL